MPAAAPWPPEVRDRALGAYLGLALGDALGATVEFMTAREIAYEHGVHREIAGGGWLRLKPGAVTDDTTMTLALGDAMAGSGAWSMDAVAASFVRWFRSRPVDCGNTCRRGISRFLANGSLSAPPSEADGGNGALMRNLPVVLAHLGDPQAMKQRTIQQCHFTHHHQLSDAAAIAFAELTRALVLGLPQERWREPVDALIESEPAFRFSPYPGRAGGYVVDTVQTVLHHFFFYADFEECVVATVNRGDDADTTGALTGMLAGARCGSRALPRRWLGRLDGAIAQRICEQTDALLALAAGSGAEQGRTEAAG